MELYLLRHEKRYPSPAFYTSLTEAGLKNSIKLASTLEKNNFDEIYCSPFLRTVQTVLPYLKKTNKKINIEYSLYESCDDPCFTIDNYHNDYSSLVNYIPDLYQHINIYYKSYLDRVLFKETKGEILVRLKNFINKIRRDNKNKSKKILFVTHMSPIKQILKEYSKEDIRFYPAGYLQKVNFIEDK